MGAVAREKINRRIMTMGEGVEQIQGGTWNTRGVGSKVQQNRPISKGGMHMVAVGQEGVEILLVHRLEVYRKWDAAVHIHTTDMDIDYTRQGGSSAQRRMGTKVAGHRCESEHGRKKGQ